MAASIEFIRADTSKLEVMAQRVWCDLERPIVACQVEFKFKEKEKYWTNWKSRRQLKVSEILKDEKPF